MRIGANCFHEFVFSESKQPCCFEVDLLSFQNVNKLELLLECNNELILLTLQLFIFCMAVTAYVKPYAGWNRQQKCKHSSFDDAATLALTAVMMQENTEVQWILHLGNVLNRLITCEYLVVVCLVDAAVVLVCCALLLQEDFEFLQLLERSLQSHIPCLGVNLTLPSTSGSICLV